jgi:pimeloyl-ACP methyl ester carboxylesterase
VSEQKRIVLGHELTLTYVEQGEASGIPLLLLHGYSDSWRSFTPLLGHLPSSLRAIALSQRGHGDSDKPEGRYDSGVLAADAVRFLDHMGIARAYILGHSMGSLVAQRIGSLHPQRVLGLVLVGAFPNLKHNAAVAELYEAVARLEDPIDPAFVRAFQQDSLSGPVPPAFLDMVVAESLKMPARVWRSALRGLIDEGSPVSLASIAAPTLILWGDRDRFAVRSDQDALLSGIAGSRLGVYPGVGHAPNWEKPAEVAADVTTFITDRVRAVT